VPQEIPYIELICMYANVVHVTMTYSRMRKEFLLNFILQICICAHVHIQTTVPLICFCYYYMEHNLCGKAKQY